MIRPLMLYIIHKTVEPMSDLLQQEGLSHDMLSSPFENDTTHGKHNIHGIPLSAAAILSWGTPNRSWGQSFRRCGSQGSRRKNSTRHNQSAGWTLKGNPTPNIVFENAFVSQFFDQRPMLFYTFAADNMETEWKKRYFPFTRGGCIAMMTERVLALILEWMNVFIRLHNK